MRASRLQILSRDLPALALDLKREDGSKIGSLFSHRAKTFWLEIGFGGGEHLLHALAHHEDRAIIGCEPFRSGVGRLLQNLDPAHRDRLRLYVADAQDVLAWLGVGVLDGIDLLYPDPWPKRRHHKRRFVNAKNLDRMARALRHGGQVRFATDSADYADWALRHFRGHEAFSWPAQRAKDWRAPYEGWKGTRYEDKAIKAGRTPVYLRFSRV